MTKPADETDLWQELPGNMLQSIRDRQQTDLSAHRFRRRVFLGSAFAALFAATVGGSMAIRSIYRRTCYEVRALLPKYIDGSLDATRHEMVFAHLKKCPSCRDELNRLQTERQA